MDVLIRFGFSIEEIKNMMDSNTEINDVLDSSISEIINILESVGCSKKNIRDIFNTNPFCLTRNVDEIKKLMAKLMDIGLLNINVLLDTNPFILNVDYKDIDSIYKKKVSEGLSPESITDFFYYESDKII